MQNLKTNILKQQNQISEDELKRVNGGLSNNFIFERENDSIENGGQYPSNYYFKNK